MNSRNGVFCAVRKGLPPCADDDRQKELEQMNKIKVEPKHKIVEKATLTDGTHIQIEDWHPCYDFEPTCGTLAAYPIAKETNTENIMNYPKRGESFRLELWFKTEEQTRQAFADLLSGKKSLKDFRENAERPHYLDLI